MVPILGAMFSAVLLSRLILNLRTENERACREGLPTVPLSTLSYPSPSRILVAPRILGNLTADLRDGDEGEDDAELDPSVTYEGFGLERDVPESRTLRNGNGLVGRTILYFAERGTEKTTV